MALAPSSILGGLFLGKICFGSLFQDCSLCLQVTESRKCWQRCTTNGQFSNGHVSTVQISNRKVELV